MKYAYSETESVAGNSDVVNSVARDLSRSNINLISGSSKAPLRYPGNNGGGSTSSSNKKGGRAIRTTDYGFIDMPGNPVPSSVGATNGGQTGSDVIKSSRAELLSSE